MGLSGSNPKEPSTSPSSIYTPFGNISSGMDGTQYNANAGNGSPYNPTQMQNEQNEIGSLTSSLGQPYNLQSAINNPYTQQLYQTAQTANNYNNAQAQQQLSNNLNAKNENGSSYGALANNLLGQQYNQTSAANMNNALTAGMSAYNQQFTNQDNALGAIGNAYNNAFSQTYAPFTAGTQYQSQALNPLIQSAMSGYNDQLNQQNNLLGDAIGIAGTTAAVF